MVRRVSRAPRPTGEEQGCRNPYGKADPVLFAALAIDTAIAVLDSFTSVVLLSRLVFGPLVAATRATTR